MLNYEKKLGLDKSWEKMQSSVAIGSCFQIVFHVISYIVSYLIFRWVFHLIPNICFWNRTGNLFSIWNMSFTTADCIYFMFGFLIYIYGSIRFIGINRQNHSVRNDENKPAQLLTSGYYARLRHPMYGAFIIRFAAVFLSLRSLTGLILAVSFSVLQYWNGFREENKHLIPSFGNEYKQYKENVKGALLQKGELFIIVIWIIVDVVGLVIK